ncbi:MAG: FkbM family methyltransferase [Cyanobacteria bacterium J06638_7]
MESASSVRSWFDFLQLDGPLRCLDVGALAGADEPEPWVRWAREGCAEVIGFEPLERECERLSREAAEQGGPLRHLPWALGDGAEHRLHITRSQACSSLYRPAQSSVDQFEDLGERMKVEAVVPLRTHRLDELEGTRPTDFIKLDVHGAELMVLEHATETLKDVAVLQSEVEFIELDEGQPLFADVDAFLRRQGFLFLSFVHPMGRPIKPLHFTDRPFVPISQLLWGDAIYGRDVRVREQWSERQRKAAVFLLHELYDAFDMAALLLGELDHRQGSTWKDCHLGSILLSHPELALTIPAPA